MNRFNNKIFLLLAIVTRAYGITSNTPTRIQYSREALLALRNPPQGNLQEIRAAEASSDTSNAARASSSTTSTSSS